MLFFSTKLIRWGDCQQPGIYIGVKFHLHKVTYHIIWSAQYAHIVCREYELVFKDELMIRACSKGQRLHSHLVVPRQSLIIETQLRVSFMRGDEADWQIAQGWVKECALGYVISSPTPHDRREDSRNLGLLFSLDLCSFIQDMTKMSAFLSCSKRGNNKPCPLPEIISCTIHNCVKSAAQHCKH